MTKETPSIAERNSPPKSLASRVGLLLALIACAAVRAAVVVSFDGVTPEQDEAAYLRVARILVDHRTYTGMWAPGYPVLLAFIQWCGADDLPTATRWVQVALGVWTTYAVARLGRAIAGPRVGLIAAWISALYVPLAGFAGMVFAETLFVALLVPALELLVRAAKREGPPPVAQTVAAGVLLGACALTRESGLALILALSVWFAFASGARSLLDRAIGTALVACAASCTIAPWTLRNAFVNDRFSPLAHSTFGSAQMGLNAHDINFEYAGLGDTATDIPGVIRASIRGTAPAEPWHGASRGNWIDRSHANVARGRAFAREHPTFFVRSRLVELIDTLAPNSFLVRSMRRYELERPLASGPLRALTVLLAVLSFPLIALLALRGACTTRSGLTLALTAATLGPALVHGMTRYRVPMLPMLFVMAAIALVGERPASKMSHRVSVALTLALVLLWIPSLEPVWRALGAAW